MKNLFPEDVRRRFGKDAEKFVAYYTENLEYLIPSKSGFAVDEDVKGLGLSNRKVELLDKCVPLLERGEQAETALRILKRYTTESFADAKLWRSWLKENRTRLFFTDVGGFKFLVGPESLIGPWPGRGEPYRSRSDPRAGYPASGDSVSRTVAGDDQPR